MRSHSSRAANASGGVIVCALVMVIGLGGLCADALGRDPHRPAGVRSCQTSELSIRMAHSMAGLGQSGGTLALTNRSASACELRGWPKLVPVTAAGHAGVARDVPGGSVGTELRGTPTVVIQPRQTAYAVFAGRDGSRSGRPCPPPFHVLKITPPQNSHSVAISAWIPYLHAYLPACGRIRIMGGRDAARFECVSRRSAT
jgi:hypothetical protein